MEWSWRIFVAVMLGWAGALPAPAPAATVPAAAPEEEASEAGAGLRAVCPVDFQGKPLAEAVHELAVRLEVPYLVDASVPAEVFQDRVRLYAAHLTGRQAFRWTVRAAGLDGVLVRGTMLIARPERLPRLWRASGSADSLAAETAIRVAQEARERQSRRHTADIAWVDAPLSVVARDVSGAFRIDLIFHPAVLAKQDLVHLEAPQATLDIVLAALREQLKVTVEFVDGALWVQAMEETATQPATGPATGSRPEEGGAG